MNQWLQSMITAMMISGSAFGADLLDQAKWFGESDHDGGSATVADGVITLRRQDNTLDYPLRALADVPVKPNRSYLLEREVKVSGPGFATATIYSGDADAKWIPGVNQNTKQTFDTGGVFVPVRSVVTTGNGVQWLRVALNSNQRREFPKLKDPTEIVIRNVRLVETGQRETALPEVTAVARLEAEAVQLAEFGASPISGTKVRAAVTEGKLWLSFELDEPEAARRSGGTATDGAGVLSDDCIEVFLSVDRVRFLHLAVNPVGGRWAEQYDPAQVRPDWYFSNSRPYTGDWSAEVKETEKGWKCVMTIPGGIFSKRRWLATSCFSVIFTDTAPGKLVLRHGVKPPESVSRHSKNFRRSHSG